MRFHPLNGAGIGFTQRYCDRCANYLPNSIALDCPILSVHHLFDGVRCEANKHRHEYDWRTDRKTCVANSILGHLIQTDKHGDPIRCAMFYERGADQPARAEPDDDAPRPRLRRTAA